MIVIVIYVKNLKCILLIGKPVSQLEFPAITICSQGWIKEVMENALTMQQKHFAEQSGIPFNPQDSNFIQMFIDTLYPGATQLPNILIPALSSPNPIVRLKSQVLVNGNLNSCQNKIYNKELPPSCPEGWISSFNHSEYCLKVLDVTSKETFGNEDECKLAGGEKLYFSEEYYKEDMFLDFMAEYPGKLCCFY